MHIVAIVQARLCSSRLPAKILLDLAGKTGLERCLSRAARIPGVAEVVVASSDSPEDAVTASVAQRLGYRVVRGSQHDVLSRYAKAQSETQAEGIVRLTSDCPLLDPAVSAVVVKRFVDSHATSEPLDYVSNTLSRRLPRGLDTEIFSAAALQRANELARDPVEREHVTMRMYRDPDHFRIAEATPEPSRALGTQRWTLDTIEDYRFLFHLFERLGQRADAAGMDEVMAVLDAAPELVRINASVEQKPLG